MVQLRQHHNGHQLISTSANQLIDPKFFDILGKQFLNTVTPRGYSVYQSSKENIMRADASLCKMNTIFKANKGAWRMPRH